MNASIKFLVRPNSSINCISGIYDDKIKIKINAPPEKGKANRELINFLSDKLNMPKKDIKIIHGLFSNIKEVQIKNKSASDILSCLLKEIS
ncbi:MAG: DUF167 domain-containing protein [Actinobacteria bacterium]|nr:DUF167 domain-containing protein [Cyanobacteriota bacterium]MCL6088154.1 DUF167 domain-containing protein [Actinomycetota bacterium]